MIENQYNFNGKKYGFFVLCDMRHSNVKEVGSEGIAYQTWEQAAHPTVILPGFKSEEAIIASIQVVSRAVNPAFELKTTGWKRILSGK